MSASLAPAFSKPERWPHAIPGLGVRNLGPATRCEFCPKFRPLADAATWSYYGGHPACLRHAQELAGAREGQA